ncbi:MAG: outer membrane beta-barrel protein [Crocinitomicaceae bacterium]|nr:outer membrane beta-barrel protein [Crocinitomicaceae bacterium]
MKSTLKVRNHISLLVLFTFFFGVSSFGQDDDTKDRKWKIGINISPEIAYRTLTTSDPSSESFIEYRDEIESSIFTLSGGLNIEYNITKRFAMRSGIQYLTQGEQYDFEIVGWPIPNPSFPSKFIVVQRYHYVGVPLIASFDFIQTDKVEVFLSAGALGTWMYRTSTKTTREYIDGTTETEREHSDPSVSEWTEYQLFNVTALISLGSDIKLGSRSFIRLEPTFKYTILPIVDGPIQERHFNVGLNIGYFIKL